MKKVIVIVVFLGAFGVVVYSVRGNVGLIGSEVTGLEKALDGLQPLDPRSKLEEHLRDHPIDLEPSIVPSWVSWRIIVYLLFVWLLYRMYRRRRHPESVDRHEVTQTVRKREPVRISAADANALPQYRVAQRRPPPASTGKRR